MTKSNDRFHDELETIYNRFFPHIRRTLFHYTNYDGLIGILKSEKIWLTDYRYLNDSSEIDYSFKKLTPIFLRELPILNKMNRDTYNLLHSILQQGNFYNSYGFYIFSTCARRNYLPTWRWYANDGAGFSIAFNFKKDELLPPVFHQESSFGLIRLGEVQYKTEMYTPYLQALLNKANELMRPEDSRFVMTALFCYILPILPLFKHYSYSEEIEYRIVALKEPTKSIPDEMKHWTPSTASVEPFVSTIPRMKIEINKMSIAYIIVGPKCNFEHVKYELNKIFKNLEYPNIPIVRSRIPYR